MGERKHGWLPKASSGEPIVKSGSLAGAVGTKHGGALEVVPVATLGGVWSVPGAAI